MADTLTVIDHARPGEAWTEAIARRLREEFVRRGLTMSKAAKLAGISQSQFSRRMTGALPFSVDEIEQVCAATGVELTFVLTGATGASGLLDEAAGSLPAAPLATAHKSIRRRALPREGSNLQPFGDYLGLNLPAAVGM